MEGIIKAMSILPKHIFVIVPSYNEGTVIGKILEELVAQEVRVVVVDDGSADETAEIALGYPVYVLKHPFNLGQGAALQTGMTFALRQPDCRYLVTFDADGQHDPQDIFRLVDALEKSNVEVALGTRFGDEARLSGIRKSRYWVLKLATWLTKLLTRLEVSDTHNGVRAFTAPAARRIHLTQNRMSHASEILAQISKLKMMYMEVPVTVRYTPYSMQKGQSIWNAIDIVWDTLVGGLK